VEDVISRSDSRDLGTLYHADFGERWSGGKVDCSGAREVGSASIRYAGEDVSAQVWFSPGQGEEMAHAVANAIAAAKARVVIASPVLTVGSILSALTQLLDAGRVPVRGVYDWTQMQGALQQWGADPHVSWKVGVFQAIARDAHFAGKHSTPYSPTSVHDYMHVKIIVVDDAVFTGSYNFSHSGEENAENLLRINSKPFADTCCAFIERVIARYAVPAQQGVR